MTLIYKTQLAHTHIKNLTTQTHFWDQTALNELKSWGSMAGKLSSRTNADVGHRQVNVSQHRPRWPERPMAS